MKLLRSAQDKDSEVPMHHLQPPNFMGTDVGQKICCQLETEDNLKKIWLRIAHYLELHTDLESAQSILPQHEISWKVAAPHSGRKRGSESTRR